MRITTTIDDELAKRAQTAAKAREESLSAFVSEAVRLRLEQLERDAAFREIEALVGKGFAKDSYRESLRELRDT
ncbi:MAG: hypothetical protein JSV66_03430 [Trueperaceae bacterium]|nr:MAG: hypothetical protein JSV66_03430 [Trueperaceae bacterium]